MQLDDFSVRRIALLLSIFGILLLVVLNEIERPVQVDVSQIDEEYLSKKIVTIGTVRKRFYTKNTLLFELWESGNISAVLFSPSTMQLAIIENNATVVVEGTIKEYRGKLEIVVERVRRAA